MDDKQNGFGSEVWPDGAKYEGNYVDGKKNGKGILNFQDGSRYEGDFQDNDIQGYGTYHWPDKRVYTGEGIDEADFSRILEQEQDERRGTDRLGGRAEVQRGNWEIDASVDSCTKMTRRTGKECSSGPTGRSTSGTGRTVGSALTMC